MCTCAVVGNGAIIEAPATGVERACDRVCRPAFARDAAGGARHPRRGPVRACVEPRRPAPSPRVPRSRARPSVWALARVAAHRRAVVVRPRSPYAVPRRTRRRGDAVRGLDATGGAQRGGVRPPPPPRPAAARTNGTRRDSRTVRWDGTAAWRWGRDRRGEAATATVRRVREAAPGVRSQLVQRVLQAECGGRREPRLFASKRTGTPT